MERKPKVVITHWVHPEIIDLLSESCEVISNQTRETLPKEEILKRARDAEGVMVFMPDIVDESFLEACQNLKIVAGAFKGYDNMDVEACTRRDVWFTIVDDLLTVPTAELGVGLLLSLARNILPGDRLVRTGSFHGWRPVLYGMGLQGRTLGIVGMGKIGKAIAARLAGFQMKMLYHDKVSLATELETYLKVTRTELDNLLQLSDYVVLAIPLLSDSFHLIDESRLQMMKQGSYLVNIGRGSVVDEEAVASALKSGRLAGYAADVFEMEDLSRPVRPASIPKRLLEETDRTVLTAHLGSAVDDVRQAIAMAAARDIIAALAGWKPKGAINDPSLAKREPVSPHRAVASEHR